MKLLFLLAMCYPFFAIVPHLKAQEMVTVPEAAPNPPQEATTTPDLQAPLEPAPQVINPPAPAKKDKERARYFEMATSTEYYRFTVEEGDDNLSRDYSGRQRKIAYEAAHVLMTSAALRVYFNPFSFVGFKYGNDKLLFKSSSNESYDAQESGLFDDKNSEIINVLAQLFGVELEATNLTFSDGKLKLYDVSGDPDGTSGPLLKSLPYVAKIQELRLTYTGKEKDIRTQILRPTFIYGRYRIPSIPTQYQTISGTDDAIFLSQGELQNINYESFLLGMDIKFGILNFGPYMGYNQHRFKDEKSKEKTIDYFTGALAGGLFYQDVKKFRWADLSYNIGVKHFTYILGGGESAKHASQNDTTWETAIDPSVTKFYINLSLIF